MHGLFPLYRKDTGEWRCEARNYVGSDISKPIIVDVKRESKGTCPINYFVITLLADIIRWPNFCYFAKQIGRYKFFLMRLCLEKSPNTQTINS